MGVQRERTSREGRCASFFYASPVPLSDFSFHFCMPQPRKPTALLELSGQLDHNPKRYENRKTEPKPTNPLGNPPKHLTKEQKSCWKELNKLAPADVLKDCDRWLVELACVLMAKLRAGHISVGESAQLLGCLSRMGLTPADRSRVAVAPSKKDEADPFAELASSIQ